MTNNRKEINGIPVYTIPDSSMTFFAEKFAKIVKRAKKLGLTEPYYKIVNQFSKKEEDPDTGFMKIWTYNEVQVFGEAPKINGWEFLGVISHLPEGNILKSIGKGELTAFINARSDCEHCDVQRKRNQTFVLRNVNNASVLKQVGSTCIIDFIGHNPPENISAMAELIAEMFSSCEDMENDEFMGGGGGTPHYNLLRYLSIVRHIILFNGWIPRSKANVDGVESTSDIAMRVMLSQKFKAEDEETTFAENAILWACDLEDETCINNEYLHNIRLIARYGAVQPKLIGYAASIVSAYERELSKRADNATNENSKHIGAIGDKIEVSEAKLIKVSHFPSSFTGGEITLSLFRDSIGNVYKWTGSGFTNEEFPLGETKTIWGTIKDHVTYNSIQQTVINRVSIVEPAWSKKSKKVKRTKF